MLEGWKQIILNDYCERITVGHVGSMANQYKPNGIPFLRSLNIHPFRLNLKDLVFIDEDFNKKLKKSELKAGDLVLVRTGYPGTACVIPENLNVANCSDLVIISPSRNLDPYFVAAVFNSSWGKQSVGGSTVGAAQQHFNIGTAKALKFLVPEYQVQKRIGLIVRNLSDLIETTNQRIILLEETARDLYKEWFVRMRFPGYKKAKFVKGVPEGWEVKKVKEIVDRRKFGRTYNPEELLEQGRVVVIDQSTEESLGYHNNEADHKATSENPMIIFGDHTCKMELVIEPFSLAENVIPFSSKNGMPIYFLFYLIESLVETTEYKRHWNELIAKSVFIGKSELQKKYAGLVKPFFEQIQILKKQNIQLRQLRDRLLPRLVSGKLVLKT